MDVGWLGEWVSGLGALAAAVIALRVSRDARQDAADARAQVVRDRVASRFVDLLREFEADVRRLGRLQGGDIWRPSTEAAVRAESLWAYRNQFSTVWDLYCVRDPNDFNGQVPADDLVATMRSELREALDGFERHEARRTLASAAEGEPSPWSWRRLLQRR